MTVTGWGVDPVYIHPLGFCFNQCICCRIKAEIERSSLDHELCRTISCLILCGFKPCHPKKNYHTEPNRISGGGLNIIYLHPRKLTCPLKRDYFNRKYIFQPLNLGDMLVFQGVIYTKNHGVSKSPDIQSQTFQNRVQ